MRRHTRGDQVYYEILESYRDEHGKVRKRHVRWLGKHKTPPPDPIPLTGLDFGDLALKLMDQSLTPEDVFSLLERIGKKPAELRKLEAIGIRFDLAQKKLWLYLCPKGYHWNLAPPRAPRARKPSGGKGRKPGSASSRSKAKPS